MSRGHRARPRSPCASSTCAVQNAVQRHGVRLTRKFIAALVIGVALVALVQGYLDYQRDREVFDRLLRGEAASLGRALGRGVADVWQRDGEAAARQFLDSAASKTGRVLARWVWIDAKSRHDQPRAARADLAPLLQDQIVVVRDDERRFMLTYIRVDVPEARVGALEIAQSLEQFDAYVNASLRTQVIASASAVAFAAVLALALGVVFIGRPISRLAAKARRVGTGDLSGPLRLGQRDELGELANEINLMCERLSDERGARELATEQLRHADRLTTVGKLASGLAHELGTPLNVVRGRAKLITDREVEGQDVVDSARIVVEQAERMTALIRQLLDFARPRPLQKLPVNAAGLARRVCELVATIARKGNVVLVPPAADDGGGGEDLHAEADDGQLTQVVTNLVVNAVQATPAGGEVSLACRAMDRAPPPYVGGARRTWVAIEVRDSGSGMDDATRTRIFEPFYTTKEVGDGTGLGLSISWGIVREHGGWIDVVSSPNKGSRFTVYLPTSESKKEPA
ncbi:MAG: HAMP domain-containing histidine kinase [Deltaproteobacteria bacterium]|nr:HAMP domain-containing histidine kinase [Deltaproteobacteria bacterium]MCW5807934.1 HAMP domain-containing histidine kinase [Deltaproteobacteria bacterium]